MAIDYHKNSATQRAYAQATGNAMAFAIGAVVVAAVLITMLLFVALDAREPPANTGPSTTREHTTLPPRGDTEAFRQTSRPVPTPSTK